MAKDQKHVPPVEKADECIFTFRLGVISRILRDLEYDTPERVYDRIKSHVDEWDESDEEWHNEWIRSVEAKGIKLESSKTASASSVEPTADKPPEQGQKRKAEVQGASSSSSASRSRTWSEGAARNTSPRPESLRSMVKKKGAAVAVVGAKAKEK